ncbi:UBX domain-containing protein 6 [Dermacentor andersoni]|uniref:UBX domain-containing protein 6 n=1 Tax=Dermacentor andersoni TaxID=34620 RepID=UPI0021556B17|nr:UBX domain-containing protein 6-like [Dermacentor andersoni]XP_050026964.1 UBX domain-containing protein 6-like [Dermacentor andersoni]
MAAIRDFFKKRKAEVKFKQAGPGRRLNADDTPSVRSPPQLQQSQQRGAPSEGAQRAAAAALARCEQQHAKMHPNWSVAAIKSQAKKELEQQLAAEEVTKQQLAAEELSRKRKSTSAVLESGPQAGDNAVVFGHPLLGPELRLPYEELRLRIRQFLYEQMSEEPGLTSCLLIHTCNSPQSKVDAGVETLCKYLNNIADNPTEEKYRRIRLNNRIFQERVLPLEGALEFLQAAGFERRHDEESVSSEEWLEFPLDGDIEQLRILADALCCAKPVKPVLDRSLRVLLPHEAAQQLVLPDSFFNLSPDEVLREQEARRREVELQTALRTKAMRERDERREQMMYRYTLVRIRLPSGLLLQGTFSVHEPLAAVREFLLNSMEEARSECMLTGPTGHALDDPKATLLELKLVPAVVLTASWGQSKPPDLLPELRAMVQPV